MRRLQNGAHSKCRINQFARHEADGGRGSDNRIQNQGKGKIMKRRSNFSLNALLSAFGAFVILCLFTAGICAALRRKLTA
jgi:hypothetical protein